MNERKNTLVTLKKKLRKKTEYELVEEIAHLYRTFPIVKQFYQATYFGEDDKVLEKYKKVVCNEFIPSDERMFPKMRISVAKKAISDYKKVACSTANVVDLMLTYVEAGISFSAQFGYSEDPLYSSVLSVFENAIKLIQKEGISNLFLTRINRIVSNSCSEYCWFEDELKMIQAQLSE